MNIDFADPLNSYQYLFADPAGYNAFRGQVNEFILEEESLEALLFGLTEAGLTVGHLLAEEVVTGALDASPYIENYTSVGPTSVTDPMRGNLYTFTVPSQVVNACTEGNIELDDTSACEVTVALTVEMLFEGAGGRPSGADPTGGPTSLVLPEFYANITSGSVSNSVMSLSFSEAPEGYHLVGDLSAEIQFAGEEKSEIESASALVETLEASIPLVLEEFISGDDLTLSALINLAGGFDVSFTGGSDSEPNKVDLVEFFEPLTLDAGLSMTGNSGSSITFDADAEVTKSTLTTYSVLFGGDLEGFDIVGETESDFLQAVVNSTMATTTPDTITPASNTVFSVGRASPEAIAISNVTSTWGANTVTVTTLEYSDAGEVETLDAENTATGVIVNISTTGGVRSGTVTKGGQTIGTISEDGTSLIVEWEDGSADHSLGF